MQNDIVEYIKNKVSILDIISPRVKLRRQGKDWFGICPFHSEKTGSFKVDPGAGFYYCFGCGAHGDIFTFMMDFEKITFPEALERIANAYGIPIPKKEITQQNPNKRNFDALEAIKLWFANQLVTRPGAEALAYLEERKISRESIEKFQLGFAGDENNLLTHLKNQKFSESTLQKIGVFSKNRLGKFFNRYSGRIIFPILDSSGKCIGFGGRIFGQSFPKETAKYINSPESEIYVKNQNLYGFSLAKKGKTREIIFVEGYLDVISMYQAGFDGTVAPLGTALSETQIEMCWKICDTPTIMLDGDSAGVKASYRWLDKILPVLQPGKSFKIAQLPQNTDPDSLIFNERVDIIKDALKNAISLSQWLWDGAFLLYPSETPEQKASIIKMIQEKISLIRDPSLKKLYFSEMKENERKLYRSRYRKSLNNDSKIHPVISADEKFEKILVVSLINHPYILDRVIESFTNINFRFPETRKLKSELLECYTKFFVNNKSEEFRTAMEKLKTKIAESLDEIIIHANFVDENVNDDDVFEGWTKVYEQYSLRPEVKKDLQNASSSLKSSFSESDWQRLKSLKKESLLMKQ